ncbi:reverse transcriptase domain-containing protein [Tanacetum coccineum]
MVKTGLVEAIDSLVPLDEHFATFRVWEILERIFKKKAKNKPNQARDGKDQVKSKSKVNHMKKIQLDSIKCSSVVKMLILSLIGKNVTSWSKKELCLDTSLNWNLLFELMCDASDFAVGDVLEFDIEIKDKKGTENVAADHLSRIDNNESSDDSEVDDNFPRETRMEINTRNEPCNKIMEKTMKRDGVNHHFSTSYHPQTSGQVENTNKALKRILEKTVKDNLAIWSRKLDDAP